MGQYDQTLGLFLIAAFFNTYLYGLVTRQCCVYFTAQFNDRWPLRAMIAFMFLLDSVESIGLIHNIWDWTVTNFVNPSVLLAGNEWPYTTIPFTAGTSAVLTQFFLAWRIWRLSGSRFLPAIAGILSLIAWAFSLVSGVEATIIKKTANMIPIIGHVATWMVVQVITDLFVATTLIHILIRSKSEFANSYSNTSIFNRLIRATIQTGLLAGIFSILGLTFFVLWRTSNLQAIFVIPIGRIYSLTLVNTLLARVDIQHLRRVKPGWVSAQGPESTNEPHQITTVISINDVTMQTSVADDIESQSSGIREPA